MEINWAVLCQNSITDSTTNNLSLINIVEELTLSVEPPKTPLGGKEQGQGVSVNIQLVALWVRSRSDEPETGSGRITLILPDSKQVIGPEFEVNLSEFQRLRNTTSLPVIPVRGEGDYRFMVEQKEGVDQWNTKFVVPLKVKINPSE